MTPRRRSIVIAALVLTQAAACSFLVDTNGLSGGASDAGNSGDSAIANEASTRDAADEDAVVIPSPTLVQERGTSGSSTTSLMVSVPAIVVSGNSLLLVAAGSEEDPTSVTGGGSWNRIARSGSHIATSVWLASDVTGGDTSITVTWSAIETTAAVLLMEWKGALKNELDVEANGNGTSITAGPIACAPGEALLAAVGMHNHSVGAPSGGFDLVDSVARDDLQILIAQSAPGSGNFSTGWTATTGDGWDTILVALISGS